MLFIIIQETSIILVKDHLGRLLLVKYYWKYYESILILFYAGTKVVGHFFEPVALKFERIASNKTTYVYHEKIIYQKLAGHGEQIKLL